MVTFLEVPQQFGWSIAMDDEIASRRDYLLETAVTDVKKWCAPRDTIVLKNEMTKNGVVRTKRSLPDTFWIELFDANNSRAITEHNANDFLVSFQLASRWVSWCNTGVARVMNGVRRSTSFDAVTKVPLLAEELRACNRQRTLQTSAASKIATFAKPAIKVFIWDRFARASVKRRDHLRGIRAKSDSDYSSFYAACERALESERRLPDFKSKVTILQRDFFQGDGIMANRLTIPVEFIERRLLDKLMFQEGSLLEWLAKARRANKANLRS